MHDVFIAHSYVQRQGKDFARGFFGIGQAARAHSKITVRFLQVDRDGIMDERTYIACLERLHQLIAPLVSYDVQVVNVFGVMWRPKA